MDSTLTRGDRYENIAIIRDAFRAKSNISVTLNDDTVICRIIKMDTRGFCLHWEHNALGKYERVHIAILSDNARFSFPASGITLFSSGYDRYIHVPYPNMIKRIQRRRYPRLVLDGKYSSRGKLNNGIKFDYKIKDISVGGCALLVDQPQHIPYLTGATLRQVEFDFNEMGVLAIDLNVLNVIPVPPSCRPSASASWRLSCQFWRTQQSIRLQLDTMITKLLLAEKSFTTAQRH